VFGIPLTSKLNVRIVKCIVWSRKFKIYLALSFTNVPETTTYINSFIEKLGIIPSTCVWISGYSILTLCCVYVKGTLQHTLTAARVT